MPAQRLRQESRRTVLRLQQTKPGYRVRVVEIPLVLGDADKITNCRIAGPGPAERSARQFGGYPASQEPPEVRVEGDGLDRRQTSRIKQLLNRSITSGFRTCP